MIGLMTVKYQINKIQETYRNLTGKSHQTFPNQVATSPSE
jgi:hypothetical protein